jgi:flagellar hook protein FlgE
MPLTSFSSAITGLNNNAQAINVISNNLANLNTTAFKASRTSFAELVGAITGTSDSGNPIQPGLGSTISGITAINTQGSIQSTGKTSDAAIDGNGFFVVDTGNGQGYTRAGNFGFDPNGDLITADGFKVMGYPAVNGVVNKAGGLADIVVPKGSSLTPKATENMGISANLDNRAALNDTFATSVQVIDSLGASHVATITFTNAGTTPGVGTSWTWAATIPAVDAGGASTDPPVSVGTGSITFDSAGTMAEIDGVATGTATNPSLNITGLTDGGTDMTINFGLLDASGNPRLTGFAADSNVSASTQDGYQSGVLKDISINSDGTVEGVYDNGKSLPLAQLALANFPNTEGLGKLEGSTFIASGLAGEPSIGTPGSGGRGTLTGAALEGSNVDIAQEFTNLIIAQRGYQACSRIITTTDQIYQDTVNLKQ